MILGIDASNISGGGGVTHLVELLRVAQPQEHGFDRVIVWSSSSTLDQIIDRPWMTKMHDPLLDRSLLLRLYWQHIMLEHLAYQEKCDVLFVPGGSYSGSFRPFVTMSQNMLPFEWREARRYGISWWTLKFIALRKSQLSTFRKADGLIFLTKYAHTSISRVLGLSIPKNSIIPHGINKFFSNFPKIPRQLKNYSKEHSFRVLYVSPIAPYKHQWHVMNAIWQLRQGGLPIKLDLVGPIRNCKNRFFKALIHYDAKHEWIIYQGEIPYSELFSVYNQADLFVFASSCENLPNILLEAMSAGLPIACSNRGPMPEVLGEAGIYFDPEKPTEIAQAIKTLVENPDLRQQKAILAHNKANQYTWKRCSRETFDFINEVYNDYL